METHIFLAWSSKFDDFKLNYRSTDIDLSRQRPISTRRQCVIDKNYANISVPSFRGIPCFYGYILR